MDPNHPEEGEIVLGDIEQDEMYKVVLKSYDDRYILTLFDSANKVKKSIHLTPSAYFALKKCSPWIYRRMLADELTATRNAMLSLMVNGDPDILAAQ